MERELRARWAFNYCSIYEHVTFDRVFCYIEAMKQIEAIISDADGTLVDTVSLIRHGQYETARQYLLLHGVPADDIPNYKTYDELLLQTVGGSARDTLERTMRLLYEASPHHLESMNFDELHDMLNPVQDSIAPEYVTAYEGLNDFFRYVGETGIKLAIFTSGTKHHIVRNFGIALSHLGLTELYKDTSKTDDEKLKLFIEKVSKAYDIPAFVVVTASDTGEHKPNPEPLNLAMQLLGVTPDQTAVLGDHKVDIQTAVNAHVDKRIGITHGFDDRETLLKNGATDIIDSLEELSSKIE